MQKKILDFGNNVDKIYNNDSYKDSCQWYENLEEI